MKKLISIFICLMMIVSLISFSAVGISAETITLVEAASEWSYVTAIGEETLPENWYAAGYDVSSWIKAPAPFGNHWSNGHATSVEQGDADLEVAFVKTFTVDNPAAFEVLTLNFYYDEDPVIYINGTEVFSASGYNTSLVEFDLTDGLSALVEGTNTIAVLMKNASTGYGFNFDLSLTGGEAPEPPPSVNQDGTIAIKEITRTGFQNFNAINDPKNILDGDVTSCSGSNRDTSKEQSFTLYFWEELEVEQIYLQCKGLEDGCITTHDDGVTFGYYDVYVDDVLVGDNVPAVSEADGGHTITLDTPVKGSTVKVEIVDEWLSVKDDGQEWTEDDIGKGNWANLADIVIWNNTDVVVPEPVAVKLNKTETTIEEGNSEILIATVTPDGTETTLTWTSDNEAVVTVDGEGKIVAVEAGTAIVTVTTADGADATCIVVVTEALDDDPVDPGNDPVDPGDDPVSPGDDPVSPGDDSSDENKDDDGGFPVWAIALIAIAFVAVVVVVIVLVKKKK